MSGNFKQPDYYYHFPPPGLQTPLNKLSTPAHTPPVQEVSNSGNSNAPIYHLPHSNYIYQAYSPTLYIPEKECHEAVQSPNYKTTLTSPPHQHHSPQLVPTQQRSPQMTRYDVSHMHHAHQPPLIQHQPHHPPNTPRPQGYQHHPAHARSSQQHQRLPHNETVAHRSPPLHSHATFRHNILIPSHESKPRGPQTVASSAGKTGKSSQSQQNKPGSARSEEQAPSTTRLRRRSAPKAMADVKYPINYPAYTVPTEMQVPTGPPGSWSVVPPQPSDIRSRKYASGVDERNFFTVLEYEINSQPIIWDYYTGYVHLTGIWKAIGNSKADIVKLLDNSPELEPVIKRVRGGFLKIQGTWVPYDVARRLAAHVCYYIRYALVPLFGPDFPDECTHPEVPGFGVLQLNNPPFFSDTRNYQGQPGAYRGDTKPNNVALPQSHHKLASAAGAPPPMKQHVFSVQPRSPVTTNSSSMTSLSSGPHLVGAATNIPLNGPKTAFSTAPNPAFHQHTRNSSDHVFKRRSGSHRARINSMPSPGLSKREAVRKALPLNRDVYDDNVFEDDDADSPSPPPPMPRKVSFTDEQAISECPIEFLEMLKATRSLQQLSAGRPVKAGGGFEYGGRQFVWDGSDRIEVLPSSAERQLQPQQPQQQQQQQRREPTPPSQPDETIVKPRSFGFEKPFRNPEPSPPVEAATATDRRLPSLSNLLNA